MCRLCGREACAECFEQVKVLTDNSGAEDADVLELQARREKHSRKNPFFLACTRRNEHQAKDFSPMTRFCKSELEVVIKEMEELLATPDPDPPLTEDTKITDLDVEMTPGDQTGSLPSHSIVKFKREDLSYDTFTKLWAKGKPLVVTGLLPQFKISWTPEHFIENYASKSCLVIQCQSDMNKRITVGDFFKEFGKYEGRKDCWKLKVIILPIPSSFTVLMVHIRTGHLQPTSKPLSRNSMLISARQYRCQITCVVTGCSISHPTFLLTRSLPTLV
jgi:lysine-specific demethylase 3